MATNDGKELTIEEAIKAASKAVDNLRDVALRSKYAKKCASVFDDVPIEDCLVLEEVLLGTAVAYAKHMGASDADLENRVKTISKQWESFLTKTQSPLAARGN